MRRKSVLIVDDHAMMREGLRAIVERGDEFEVVGEAGNAREALEAARTKAPDLATVDIALPDANGIELTRDLAVQAPDTRVLIVSMHSKVDYIAEAFRAGAVGFVAKESAGDRLLTGLAAVSRGQHFLDSSLSRDVVRRIMGAQSGETDEQQEAYRTLTSREREVFALLAQGMSAKEIGSKLHISPKTVENHRANIMKKLNLHSIMELVRYAARVGVIDIEKWVD